MADRSDIDEVRRRTDLVSVVEKYVTLKRAGRGLSGLCPFHKEKTPSFHVNPELGLWKCFGQCNEGGDVFKFVQKIENLSFPETLERLALRAGVTLTCSAPPGTSPGRGEPRNGPRATSARSCIASTPWPCAFIGKRCRDRPSPWTTCAGAASPTRRRKHSHWASPRTPGICSSPFSPARASPSPTRSAPGWSRRSERGSYFDKLRGRLIFPIFDVQDRPIAFGGRLLGEAGPGSPKYWNSPETPVFSKSRTLYGLGRARKAIADRGRAVVVEGYTDVVAAHQSGFENVVATLGTSLTEEHVKTLARLAPTVLLAFDANSAGLKAAFRAAEIFEAQEVEVRVLDLPEGEDPDSLLRANKRLVFEQAMDNAMPLVQYRLESLIRKADTGTEPGRLALFKKALPVLASVPSVIEREQYVKRLAPFHPQFSAGAVYAEEHIRQDVAGYQSGRMGHAPSYPAPAPPPRPLSAPPRVAAEQAERQLLRALVAGEPALAETVLSRLTPEEFWTERGRALASCLYAAYAADFEPDMRAVLADLESRDAPLANALTDLLMDDDEAPALAADAGGRHRASGDAGEAAAAGRLPGADRPGAGRPGPADRVPRSAKRIEGDARARLSGPGVGRTPAKGKKRSVATTKLMSAPTGERSEQDNPLVFQESGGTFSGLARRERLTVPGRRRFGRVRLCGAHVRGAAVGAICAARRRSGRTRPRRTARTWPNSPGCRSTTPCGCGCARSAAPTFCLWTRRFGWPSASSAATRRRRPF